jgi:hypothetical protein
VEFSGRRFFRGHSGRAAAVRLGAPKAVDENNQMETSMASTFRGLIIGAAALASVGAFAPAAFASCSGSVRPASYQVGSNDARLIRTTSLTLPDIGGQGIVGLWAVSLVAGGAQVDWGYAEWHSDGTEIMNSGGHSPASGNFCLGVWRQTGPNTFHLKHYPLAYNPATGVLAAKIILTEDVTVDRSGADFAGPFTEDVYDPTGVTLLQHTVGTIRGHRVLPN